MADLGIVLKDIFSMEQNDIQSQHIENQRSLIRRLIQNQRKKQIKNCDAELKQHPAGFEVVGTGTVVDLMQHHPAANFSLYLIFALIVLSVTMSFALASARNNMQNIKQEPISIVSSKYSVSDMDLGRYNDCRRACEATVWTEDHQYSIEVEFDYTSHKDGNGVGHTWREIEITRSLPKAVYDDYGAEVNAYIDRYEIEFINDALIEVINKKLGA